jgi:hypothetical protein
MGDNLRAAARALQHGYERNRFEEQLWTMAYEYIWPLRRRSLKPRATAQHPPAPDAAPRRCARRA